MIAQYKFSRFSLIVFLITICIFNNSCKDDEADPEPQEDFVSDFYANTTDLEIIVGYEDGAEPYIF